jgi:hypothetical protein
MNRSSPTSGKLSRGDSPMIFRGRAAAWVNASRSGAASRSRQAIALLWLTTLGETAWADAGSNADALVEAGSDLPCRFCDPLSRLSGWGRDLSVTRSRPICL